MSIRRVFSILLVLGLLLFGCKWAFTSGPLRYQYPSQTTESAFCRQYTSDHLRAVISGFAVSPETSTYATGSGAGRDFVTNELTFGNQFAGEPGNVPVLLTAISDDMATSLAEDGATNLKTTKDPMGSFHLSYRLGQVLGSVTVSGNANTNSLRITR